MKKIEKAIAFRALCYILYQEKNCDEAYEKARDFFDIDKREGVDKLMIYPEISLEAGCYDEIMKEVKNEKTI